MCVSITVLRSLAAGANAFRSVRGDIVAVGSAVGEASPLLVKQTNCSLLDDRRGTSASVSIPLVEEI
jgi:hypothetical protein